MMENITRYTIGLGIVVAVSQGNSWQMLTDIGQRHAHHQDFGSWCKQHGEFGISADGKHYEDSTLVVTV
jgi:hypothetical protein